MTRRPLHVLVVDDSAVVREAMSMVLGSVGGIMVATAADPIIARRRIAVARPDVIVLDLEMPRVDGLTFLQELMESNPIPVVICSSHSTHGSQVALEALRLGAVDVVAKPRLGVREFVQESSILLSDAVRGAAKARPQPRLRTIRAPARAASPAASVDGRPSDRLIAIAASTGGPQALQQVLGELPGAGPGVLVVQHMPEGFTAAFARRLHDHCAMAVKEAEDGDVVIDGRALIAAGDRHLAVRRERDRFVVEVQSGPLVSRHRPSADVLFRSVAEAAGAQALGVIMTGMGDDGADGLEAMKTAGAWTLAQDEESCVVYGMPREAVIRGAVEETVPLAALSERIATWGRGTHQPAASRAPANPPKPRTEKQ